jgi:hypothetical protein
MNGQGYFLSYETPNYLGLVVLTSFGWDVKPRSSLCHTHSIIHGLKRSRRSCPRRVSAGYKKTLYQACTFPEVGMWPPKRWEIESGHIRISSWVQGEQPRGRHSRLSLSVPLWNVPWPKEWNWCARADLHFKQRTQAGRVIVYVFLTKTLTFPQSSQARKRPSSHNE